MTMTAPSIKRAAAGTLAAATLTLTACTEPFQPRPATGDLDIVWQVSALSLTAPVLADSLVILRLAEGTVVALRREDGSIKWNGGGVGFNFTAPMRLVGDALVIPHEVLTAVDARTGELLWEREDPAGEPIHSSPAVLGNAIFAAEEGAVVALDATTGGELWHVAMPGQRVFAPTAGNGIVAVHSRGQGNGTGGLLTDGALEVYEVASGERRWLLRLPAPESAGPVIAGVAILDDRVVVTTLSGRMLALSITDGTQLWELPEPATQGPAYAYRPTLFAGLIAYLRGDGSIEARSPVDGSVAWLRELPSLVDFNQSPVTCGLHLCQGSGAMSVLTALGDVAWSSDDEASLTFLTGPAVDQEGVVYAGVAISQNDVRIIAFRPAVTIGPSLRR